MEQMTQVRLDCIASCRACQDSCTRMASLLPGKLVFHTDHFHLMLDCAQMCGATADFLIRDSAWHGAVCDMCARICKASAQSCEHSGDMEECAQNCLTCAALCLQVAQATT